MRSINTMQKTTAASIAHVAQPNPNSAVARMSTENAAWLYNSSLVGDPVVFTGSDRGMTLDNGYGDWNESFKEYKQGSALH